MHFDGLLFDECDFTGADLTGTSFYKCGLEVLTPHRVNADGASFINVNMREARLQSVTLLVLILQHVTCFL